MKANELRIGNVYQYFGNDIICHVEQIVKDDRWQGGYKVISTCGQVTAISSCRAIPLSEGLLLKCGFEKINRDGVTFFLKGDCFELHKFNQYGHFSYTCGDNLKSNFISARIDSLHQLQNLYFSLVGEELEVNL